VNVEVRTSNVRSQRLPSLRHSTFALRHSRTKPAAAAQQPLGNAHLVAVVAAELHVRVPCAPKLFRTAAST
jgi:hypothetical protein